MGPPIELTSCLLPDVTVGLAQQTPLYEIFGIISHLEHPDSNLLLDFSSAAPETKSQADWYLYYLLMTRLSSSIFF